MISAHTLAHRFSAEAEAGSVEGGRSPMEEAAEDETCARPLHIVPARHLPSIPPVILTLPRGPHTYHIFPPVIFIFIPPTSVNIPPVSSSFPPFNLYFP